MSDDHAIDRILVALDGSPESLVALHTAVSLAASLPAEVIGLFVEDINLLRLADLPFSQEVVLTSADAAALSRQRMAQLLRAQAARARKALDQAGIRASVTTTFRTVRGQVPLAVVTASMDVDLLVLGRVSRPVTRRLRLGSTARAALQQAARAVLVTGKTPAQPPVTLVGFDGSPTGWQGLAKAIALTPTNSEVIVVFLGGDSAAVGQWQQETAVWLRDHQRRAAFRHLPQPTLDRLALLAQQGRCDLLVMGSDMLTHNADTFADLLAELECALLLIRP